MGGEQEQMERLLEGTVLKDVLNADPCGPSRWTLFPVAADAEVSTWKQLQGGV